MNTISKSKQADRNSGIDFLRLLSMFMVVVLHVLAHGGVLQEVAGEDAIAVAPIPALLKVICFCAVDCFAIITGYVFYQKKYNVIRYLKIWIIASFFSGIIAICVALMRHDLGAGSITFSVFPVFSRKYWYLTAYTGLYFLMPIINTYTENNDKESFNKLYFRISIGLFVFAPISEYMFGGSLFPFGGGYSVPWLAFLYMTGIWIKRNDLKKVNKVTLILILVILICCCWIVQMHGNTIIRDLCIKYESPLFAVQAIIWVCLFERIRFSGWGMKVITFLAPSAFSVYLIHDNPLIRELFIKNRFIWVMNYSALQQMLLIILIAGSIFFICLTIDITVRRPIFKIFRVDERIEKLALKIQKNDLFKWW